ncbi:AmmeMemoRadiSam system protein B [Candidatus Sumerlaeota bacterium]|nr:AmmeMemoRadiSam system protein B [Candidatus Sumerlaeota bacterium]
MTMPKIRNVSLQQATINGAPFLILKDPENFAEQALFIPDNEPMLYILGLLDGKHTILDIQENFMRTFGALLMSEQLNDIINALNDNHYLENEDFERFKQEALEDFRRSPVRSSSLAGMSYPLDPAEVKKLLQSMLDQARYRENPGMKIPENPRGLIAPHIDFIRGGHVYGAIYNVLPQDAPPDIFVILGTAHAPSSSLFIPTRKSFETPLGIAKTTTQIFDEMEKEISPDILYRDEFLHRGEHSVEFQVLWLQYLFPECDDMRILPILCSSIEHFMEQGILPEQNEEYLLFTDRLIQSLRNTGKRMVIIASADLSHVGASFGDAFSGGVPDDFLEETRMHDRFVLEAAQNGDAHEFFNRVASCGNRYRICGLAPIYAMLHILKALGKEGNDSKGIMVDYDQSLDTERTTSVSFTGMIF